MFLIIKIQDFFNIYAKITPVMCMKSFTTYLNIYFIFIKTVSASHKSTGSPDANIPVLNQYPVIESKINIAPFISMVIKVNSLKYSHSSNPCSSPETCVDKKVLLNAKIKISYCNLTSTDKKNIDIFHKIKKLRFDSYTDLKNPGKSINLLFSENNKNYITSEIFDLQKKINCVTKYDPKLNLSKFDLISESSINKNIDLAFMNTKTTFVIRFLNTDGKNIFDSEFECVPPIFLDLSLHKKTKPFSKKTDLIINLYNINEYIQTANNHNLPSDFEVPNKFPVSKKVSEQSENQLFP